MRPKWKLRKALATLGPKAREPRYVPDYDGTDRDHMARLHTLPCALRTHPLPGATPCAGELHVHHSTVGRGKSQRTDDRKAMPLCRRHHLEEFHDRSGTFLGWTKAQRRRWQEDMSAFYAPKTSGHVAPGLAGPITRRSLFGTRGRRGNS